MQHTPSKSGGVLPGRASISLAAAGALLLLVPGFVFQIGAWVWPGAVRGVMTVAATASETARFTETRTDSESSLAARFDTVDTADIAIDRVREGRSDAGIAPSFFLAASSGFEGVANLGWMYLHLIVPSGSEVNAFRDIAGRRLGLGATDPAVRVLLDRMFKYYGFPSPPQIVEQHNADLETAFLDGEIDAAVFLTGLFDDTAARLLATGWYDFISVPEADAIAAWLPGTSSRDLPFGVYGPERTRPDSATAPVRTLAVARLVFTRAGAPSSTVDALLRAIESLPPVEYALVSAADKQEVSPLPMHRAAARIYSGTDPLSGDTSRAKVRWAGVLVLAFAFLIELWRRFQANAMARGHTIDDRLRDTAAKLQQVELALEALAARWDRALTESGDSSGQSTVDVDAPAPRESVSIFVEQPAAREVARAPQSGVEMDDEVLGAARPRPSVESPAAVPGNAAEIVPDSRQMGLPF